MGTETAIRFSAFLGVFAILAMVEIAAPRRKLTTSKRRRWFANLTIVALNTLSVTLVFLCVIAARCRDAESRLERGRT